MAGTPHGLPRRRGLGELCRQEALAVSLPRLKPRARDQQRDRLNAILYRPPSGVGLQGEYFNSAVSSLKISTPVFCLVFGHLL
jgi:hypothetical protein